MTVELTKKAKSQLKKLPKQQATKITRILLALQWTPLLGKKLEGKLQDRYSLRAWPYRIIYQIFTDNKIVLINTIEHRQGAYK